MSTCKACGKDAAGLYCEACRVPKADAKGGKTWRLPSARTPRITKPKPEPRTEGLDSLVFTLYGAPRTKKTHNRLVKHRGRHKVLPSIQWTRWRDKLEESGQVTAAMRLRDQPYNCAALFYRDANRGDATGFYQGLADVLEYLGVVSNDKWLVTWNGSDLLVDRDHPRVEITLTLVSPC